MSPQEPLLEELADALPLDVQLDFHYISTLPTPCAALFSSPPGHKKEETTCENHLLTASWPSKEPLTESGIFVFGIELLVFSTLSLTTIFVSKADSTGYLSVSVPQSGSQSIIKTLCQVLLSSLVKRRLDGPRIVLSLFARSQPQYLFPGSSDNPGKHILNDRQLIKWWAGTIDPLLGVFKSPQESLPAAPMTSGLSPAAYIVVPGCDKYQTRSFFPPEEIEHGNQRWTNSYPVELMVQDRSAPLRCLIPRLPDDPKARFLLDLDTEISDEELSSSGKWRSVRSFDQFWELMSYRQECASGRLVGFIWVIFAPPTGQKKLASDNAAGGSMASDLNHSPNCQLPTPAHSQSRIGDGPLPRPSLEPISTLDAVATEPPPPSSPTSIKSTMTRTPEPSKTRKLLNPPITPKITPSPPSRKPSYSFPLLVTPTAYESLQTYLLDDTDFSTPALATESTRSWTQRVTEEAGLTATPPSSILNPAITQHSTHKPSFKIPILGPNRHRPKMASGSQPLPALQLHQPTSHRSVSYLSSTHTYLTNETREYAGDVVIRKKRKAPAPSTEDGGAESATTMARTASPVGPDGAYDEGGKEKAGSRDRDGGGQDTNWNGSGVTTLSAELVRKKRRATPGELV